MIAVVLGVGVVTLTQFQETEKAYGGRAAYDQAKSEGKTQRCKCSTSDHKVESCH